jgi:tRNA-binding EMAP/Myf-like protein
MNDVMKDITAVVMAIVGVALLTVIVSNKNQTSQVIGAATGGTANLLAVAMGGAPSAGMGLSMS